MATTNGRKPARKMPVKTATVHLEGDYEGWEFTFRTNPPLGKWTQGATMAASYNADDPGRSGADMMEGMFLVLEAVLLSWNFVDENGENIEPTRDGLSALPLDLVTLLFSKVSEGLAEAPLAIASP